MIPIFSGSLVHTKFNTKHTGYFSKKNYELNDIAFILDYIDIKYGFYC